MEGLADFASGADGVVEDIVGGIGRWWCWDV